MRNFIKKLGLAGIVAGAIGAIGLVGNLAYSQKPKEDSNIPVYRVNVDGRSAYELPAVEGGYDVFQYDGKAWRKMGEINPPKKLILMFVPKNTKRKPVKLAELGLERKIPSGYGVHLRTKELPRLKENLNQRKMPPAYITKPHPYKEGTWIRRVNPDYVYEIQKMVPGEIVDIEPGYMAVYRDSKTGRLIHFNLPPIKQKE